MFRQFRTQLPNNKKEKTQRIEKWMILGALVLGF